jgi:hypothetical protein
MRLRLVRAGASVYAADVTAPGPDDLGHALTVDVASEESVAPHYEPSQVRRPDSTSW